MGHYVLIDKERLRFVKAAPTYMQAEYWSAILCKNRDTYLCGPQKRYFSHFSDMELRMLWANAHGGQEAPAKEYSELVAAVAALAERLPLDMTSEEALAKKLGRVLVGLEEAVDSDWAKSEAPPVKKKGTNNPSVSSKPARAAVTMAATSDPTPAGEASMAKPKAKKAGNGEKVKRIEKHGVLRPREGGKCAAVWDICDKLKSKKGKATAADVLAEGTKHKLLESNVRCEYQRWKKFNGISGRVE